MELQQQYQDSVTFIGVPEPNEDVDASTSFVERTGSSALTHIHDPEGAVWSAFGVSRRQTYIVIDEAGMSQQVDFGGLAASVEQLAG